MIISQRILLFDKDDTLGATIEMSRCLLRADLVLVLGGSQLELAFTSLCPLAFIDLPRDNAQRRGLMRLRLALSLPIPNNTNAANDTTTLFG